MNFAAATGHRLGRATPCLRDTPQRKLMGTTGRRSTYRRRNAVQANPATSRKDYTKFGFLYHIRWVAEARKL